MTITRNGLKLGLAVAAVLASTATALAAYATSGVNVRNGPGTEYRVVDQLQRGEWVDIDRCVGSWCFVRKSGPDGWVSSRYLTRDRIDRPRDTYREYDDRADFYIRQPRYRDWRPHRPWRYDRRWRDPRSSVCLGGPNASFCISN